MDISLAIARATLQAQITDLEYMLNADEDKYNLKSDQLAERLAIERIKEMNSTDPNRWEAAVKGEAVEAEYEEVTIEEKPNLPSIKYEPVRHPKLAGVEKDYIKEVEENLRLDEELELPRQAAMDRGESLTKDIDELTDVNDFHEITKRQVEELFEIPKMQLMCYGHNIKEVFKGLFRNTQFRTNFFFFATSFLLSTICWCCVDYGAKDVTAGNVWSIVFGVVFAIGVVVSFIALVTPFSPTPYKFSFLKVGLKVEPLAETLIKIPKGAKLRTLEAKKAGLFSSFVIARPDCTIEEKEFRPRVVLDPAILGVAPDKRMFMIVYWDIKNDIEKTVEKIDRFKKFKLKEA